MRFLPHHKFLIESHLSTAEVLDILSQVVQAKRAFWPNPFSDGRKHFVGFLSIEGFSFVRNVYYLNSFLPQIQGKISESGDGSIIVVTMACNLGVVFVFATALAFLGFFLASIISPAVSALTMIASAMGGLVLGYIAYTLGFNTQEVIDRRFLVQLFPQDGARS
ncbi:hypothetical protein [Desulfuromonas acetoxidans]|uniref:hypothetical protein n=1 Tax=Desulfuromonas acetoxidans TaxID=891 RepID=UPI002930A63B|nr:hypothetical protein [Desulfuromonas acetoxidans]